MFYAATTSALAAISLLTLSWWGLERYISRRQSFYIGVSVVSLLASIVIWLLIQRISEVWPLGIAVALGIDACLFSRRQSSLSAATRSNLSAFNAIGSVLLVAVTVLASVQAAQPDQAQARISTALRQQRKTDHATIQKTLSELQPGQSLQLQNMQIGQQFDQVAELDHDGLVLWSGSGEPLGSNLWRALPWLALNGVAMDVDGIAILPSGQLAEIEASVTTTTQLVGVRYINGPFLAKVDAKDGWAIATKAGIIAATPNPIPSGIWQSTELDNLAQNLSTKQYQERLTYSGIPHHLQADSIPTITGDSAYVVTVQR